MKLIATLVMFVCFWANPSSAELPHWVHNPQQAADEDEVAFLGSAESPKGIDAAKIAAQADAVQKATAAVMDLLNAALPELKKATSAYAPWDESAVRVAVKVYAEGHFRAVPVEKWHGTMSSVAEGDQLANVYVFLQVPKMDIARLVIDGIAIHLKQGNPATQHADLKTKVRAAVGTATSVLPP